MKSIEVFIIVEGKTERTFVRDVLAPYMSLQGVHLHPAIIGTPGHKGGDIRFERAAADIGKFLQQRPNTFVSTMFDYFKIESVWPGRHIIKKDQMSGRKLSALEKAIILEHATHEEVTRRFVAYNAAYRFVPHIEMHEFEALLFSDAEVLSEKLKVKTDSIVTILAQYDSPEDINDGPDTAPSKRLAKIYPAYCKSRVKVTMGKTITTSIGIRKIRQQCRNFDAWLGRLEQLQPF